MKHLPLIFFVILILMLSIFNLRLYISEQKVLGTKTEQNTQIDRDLVYWREFLEKKPTYFDGWIELYSITGDENYLQKAKEIKPNYF